MTQTDPNFRAQVAAEQRLLILQTLRGCADYCANNLTLHHALEAGGYAVSALLLDEHLEQLDEQALVTCMRGRVTVSRLTQRGEDVASGRARAVGVARPRPGG